VRVWLRKRGKDEPDPAEPRTDEGAWTPPKPTVSPGPQYPQAAFDAKVQGTVLVEVLIGEEGEVAHLARPSRTSPWPSDLLTGRNARRDE
jgi:Gram-negative bacterial TonB protein C-terminal